MLYRLTQTIQRIVLRAFFVDAHSESNATAKARLAQNRLSVEESVKDSEVLETTCEPVEED